MEKVWIGTSWKMNKTLKEAMSFTSQVKAAQAHPRIQRFLVPSFTTLREVRSALSESDILVGAQNMHWEEEGAWTGEISPRMLRDCSADLVEIGHSERRAHFGETNQTVGLKVRAAVQSGLVPLVCIGETREQMESGKASSVLAEQVEAALSLLGPADIEKQILFAYEPVWAIGFGGTPATPEYADERQAEIGDMTRSILGSSVPCLYGGSVNSENCAVFAQMPNINGLFVGRAAWSANGYLDILRRCASVL